MKEIIVVNILLIFILPMYITFTKFGNIEFGEFFATVTIILTIVSLFHTAVKLSSMDDNKIM